MVDLSRVKVVVVSQNGHGNGSVNADAMSTKTRIEDINVKSNMFTLRRRFSVGKDLNCLLQDLQRQRTS